MIPTIQEVPFLNALMQWVLREIPVKSIMSLSTALVQSEGPAVGTI